MTYRGTGKATVNLSSPDAFAVCDRCGTWRNKSDLVWQWDWRGNAMTNLRLLVCKERERCNDAPFEFNRPIIIAPDPVPVKDPRPEWFSYSENPNNPPVTVQSLLQTADEDESGT